MNTPNDLPSVGTEDARSLADEMDTISERITRYSNSFGDGVLAIGADKIRKLVSERDALAGRVAELERDAKRWEMLAYMHTRGVTFHVYEHYIGNPDRLDYAATLHREYLSSELARAALSATTPESKP